MPPPRIAALLLGAHILSMLGFATYPALLPELRDLWQLSNAGAGMIGSAFFGGYIATVAWWTAFTDRSDGRRVYFAGCLLAVLAGVGFGYAADGLASAVFFQALAGAGVAGTYMPGLRLLSDRIGGALQSRYIAFYTSFFGVGTALSFVLADFIAPRFGWRMAFVLPAAGAFLAGLLVMRGLQAVPHARPKPALLASIFPLAAWRRVLANRAAAGYMLGYCVHCVELFSSRSWMVAFLAFSASLHAPGASFPWHAATIAAAVNLLAVPASILGNELALKIGRQAWIQIVMLVSALCGLALGLSAGAHWGMVLALLIVYSMLVMADSATLTAGLVAAAPPELRGAAMGLYSLFGFGGGMLGPTVFGVALDAAGGGARPAAWAGGYLAAGAGCLVLPLVGRLFGTMRRAGNR